MRKRYVIAYVVFVLCVLGYFKYADFFIQNVSDAAAALGFHPDLPLLHLVVPVGVSFYNFQSMSYALDVYRGQTKPTRNFIEFALCVAFFTHLVAGPIVRVGELLPQIERGTSTRWDDVVAGINRFAQGFASKALVADNLAPYVDRVFADPGSYDGVTLWCASIAFAVQIYCDFSGYTDMAIGSARLLGLPPAGELRLPLLLARNRRVLAPLAHHAVVLDARLPLHPAGRQARRAPAPARNAARHHGARAGCGTAPGGNSSASACCTASTWRSRSSGRRPRERTPRRAARARCSLASASTSS